MWFTAHAEWEQASLSTTEVTRQYRSVSLARWPTSDPTSLSVELLLRGRNAEWTWHVTGGRVARMVGVGAMRLKASQTMEQREKKGGGMGWSLRPPTPHLFPTLLRSLSTPVLSSKRPLYDKTRVYKKKLWLLLSL